MKIRILEIHYLTHVHLESSMLQPIKCILMMMIRHLYFHLSGVFLVSVSCLLIPHLQVLPVEYGGTGGSLAEITEFWVTEAVKQKDWFARFFELVVLYI